MQSSGRQRQDRKEVFQEVVQAFEDKYSWLGHQAARELLLSIASWNIEKNNDVPMRFRTHCMLAWKRGWLKSSILSKMGNLLGEDMVSMMGKVTAAGMRGSVSGGQFTPPKPLKSPIVISTEFGQTTFEDELLNTFLALLEEGKTNITLNKVASLGETNKRNIESRHNGAINFGESNEFDLDTNFVFWGATYDPRKLQDDAMRSRFNVVTPAKPLTGEVTEAIDKGSFNVPNKTIRDLRAMVRSEEPSETNFTPPSHLYKKYSINPRESRDLQSYMASRNWWGLEVNPEIMEGYIKHLKESRRRATMSPDDLVMEHIFDNPLTYREIQERTGFEKKHVYQILQQLNAKPLHTDEGVKYAIWSGDGKEDESTDDDNGGFLDNFL